MSPLFSTLSKFPEDRTSKLKKITEIDGSINDMAKFHLFKFPGEFDAMIQDHISKKLPKGINETLKRWIDQVKIIDILTRSQIIKVPPMCFIHLMTA